MKQFFTLVLFTIVLLSCGSKKSMALHPERLSLGITKQKVVAATGEHIPMKIIGSKAYPNGTIKVGQFYDKLIYCNGLVEEVYYWYFLKDKHIQWARPQDWQREADKIYEIRFR